MVGKVAVSLVSTVLLGGALAVGTATPASSAGSQRICSSSNSEPFTVVVNGQWVQPTKCVTVAKGTQVYLDAPSHKVGYDKHPYSGCRTSPSGYFTPYQGADIIYFWTFPLKDCHGIGVAGRQPAAPTAR